MLPEAFEKFRVDFGRHLQSQSREVAVDQKLRTAELRQAEAKQTNLVRAVSTGHTHSALFEALTLVEAELKVLRAQIEAHRPRQIEMPTDLPALYRTHIEDLVGTLLKEPVAGRAGNALRKMI